MSSEYEKVASFESLLKAHQRTRLGKGHKPDTVAFEMDLARNLWEIKDQLDNHDYNVKDYFPLFELFYRSDFPLIRLSAPHFGTFPGRREGFKRLSQQHPSPLQEEGFTYHT